MATRALPTWNWKGANLGGQGDDDQDHFLDEEGKGKTPVRQPVNNGKSKDEEGGDALPPLPKDKEWKNVRADSLILLSTLIWMARPNVESS